MARSHVTEEEAFDMLRRASQRMNAKLRDVAADIAKGAAPG
jgi:AmiR/NasT family two-component response regulator